jgi:hypothetical protein
VTEGSESLLSARFGTPIFQARKVYVASSWRNDHQPLVVEMLRQLGHEVYDFRNPRPGDIGFAWSEIDPDWLGWSPRAFRDLLDHPIAQGGFKSDFDAMKWADTFVLMLPCGRSAHLEAGWAIGAGKPTCLVLHEDKFEPELMYLMADRVAVDLDEMCDWIDRLRPVGLTHGRHCPCSSCRREDWTQPHLGPCGMHGTGCPPIYAPIVGVRP